MNLLISFHSIFQDEKTSGRENDAGQEEDLEVAGGRRALMGDRRTKRRRTMRRRGTRRVHGWTTTTWGWWVYFRICIHTPI
jgi:hypothetical protein